MGFLSSLFGSSANEFDAISFVKKVTNYSCNQAYINLSEMQREGAYQAFQLNPNLPRVMQQSPLTMVGEFNYLLKKYESKEETEALKKVIHAILIFINKYRSELPDYINVIFHTCLPTSLLLEVCRETGLSMYESK